MLSWLFDSTSSITFNFAFCLASVLAGTALCALASSRPLFLLPDLVFRVSTLPWLLLQSLLSTIGLWSLFFTDALKSKLWSCHLVSLLFGFSLEGLEVNVILG